MARVLAGSKPLAWDASFSTNNKPNEQLKQPTRVFACNQNTIKYTEWSGVVKHSGRASQSNRWDEERRVVVTVTWDDDVDALEVLAA